ncbi:hypothetical protein [Actinomadura sp. NPDC000600]|uniref:hypothetical protein n=1 Tax=Actinomadura sp. NPDC000600 TaxID=3154262 RepID=UPI0033941267
MKRLASRPPGQAWALAPILALALAGCSSGHAAPSATGPSTGNSTQQMLELGKRVAQCARTHGYPNFPDPALNTSGDDVVFSPPGGDVRLKSIFLELEKVPECKAVLRQMSSISKRRSNTRSSQDPGPKDVPALRRFAQCLREHGIPEWPDPKADGTFPLMGTPLAAEGKSQRMVRATRPCVRYWSGRIAAS